MSKQTDNDWQGALTDVASKWTDTGASCSECAGTLLVMVIMKTQVCQRYLNGENKQILHIDRPRL